MSSVDELALTQKNLEFVFDGSSQEAEKNNSLRNSKLFHHCFLLCKGAL